MTEAEARAALRAFVGVGVGVGDVEPWIADQSWKAPPGGGGAPVRDGAG